MATSHGFKRSLFVDGRGDSDDKFAAVFPISGSFREWFASRAQSYDPFFDDLIKLFEHFGFGGSVAALSDQWGGAANEAVVFVTPFDQFHVFVGGIFDLFAGEFHYMLVSS
jgi:hypothetical protein